MISSLMVYNFQPGFTPSAHADGVLVLATCQRQLWISMEPLPFVTTFSPEIFQGEKAYAFLLEVLCGLRSKLVAETEITRQFKKAYADYLEKHRQCGLISKVVERVMKDAKEIRHLHLRQVSGRSYASLCRKIVSKEKAVSGALIVGSGDLAKDLIRFFKDTIPLAITARNHDVLATLSKEHQLQMVPWVDYEQWSKYQCIINTVGIEESLFEHGFFEEWKATHASEKVFIDLGSPSPIRTSYSSREGVYRLDDILKLADDSAEQNKSFVSAAIDAIAKRAAFRNQYFEFKKRRQCCGKQGAHCAHL